MLCQRIQSDDGVLDNNLINFNIRQWLRDNRQGCPRQQCVDNVFVAIFFFAKFGYKDSALCNFATISLNCTGNGGFWTATKNGSRNCGGYLPNR